MILILCLGGKLYSALYEYAQPETIDYNSGVFSISFRGIQSYRGKNAGLWISLRANDGE